MISIASNKSALEKAFSFYCRSLRRALPGGRSLLPATIIWEVTYRCNLRCDMCFFYGPRGRRPDIERELSTVEVEVILRDIKKAYRFYPYKPFIAVTGGEPFCRKDIFSILRSIEALGFRYSITTNFACLDDKMLEELSRLRPSDIRISIDGPEEVHDRIRGVKGTFQKAMQNIMSLLKLLRGKELPLLLKCVISQENARNLDEVLDIAVGLGINIQYQHLMFLDEEQVQAQRACARELLGEPLDTPWYDIRSFDRETVAAICKSIAYIVCRSKDLPIEVSFLPTITGKDEIRKYYLDLKGYRHSKYCSFPWGSIRLSPAGDLFHCIRYSYGNLQDDSFKALQNNARMRRFRMILKREGLFPGCVRCCRI